VLNECLNTLVSHSATWTKGFW